MSKIKIFLIIGFFLFGIAISFQNCGGFTPLGFGENGSNGRGGGGLGGSGDDIEDIDLIPQATSLLMERNLVAAKLTQIFDNDNDSETIDNPFLSSFLTQSITRQIAAFGGPCSLMNTGGYSTCIGTTSNMSEPTRPDSTSLREGYRLKVCDQITEQTPLLSNAMRLVGGTLAQPPTSQQIDGIFHLFYSTQRITPEVKKELTAVVEKAGEIGAISDTWRFLILSVCSSAGWQIL